MILFILILLFIFVQWHCLAQRDAKLVAQSNLSNLFTLETFYAFGCQSHVVIPLA